MIDGILMTDQYFVIVTNYGAVFKWGLQGSLIELSTGMYF